MGGNPKYEVVKQTAPKCCALAMVEDITPLENEHFEWPSLDETREIKEKERKHVIHRDLINDAEISISVITKKRI